MAASVSGTGFNSRRSSWTPWGDASADNSKSRAGMRGSALRPSPYRQRQPKERHRAPAMAGPRLEDNKQSNPWSRTRTGSPSKRAGGSESGQPFLLRPGVRSLHVSGMSPQPSRSAASGTPSPAKRATGLHRHASFTTAPSSHPHRSSFPRSATQPETLNSRVSEEDMQSGVAATGKGSSEPRAPNIKAASVPAPVTIKPEANEVSAAEARATAAALVAVDLGLEPAQPNSDTTHSNSATASPVLKDSVKVAVRVRPMLPMEEILGSRECVDVRNGKEIVLGRKSSRQFTFDHALPPQTTQQELFNKCVLPMLHGCFDGYNATIFAYGQTGSGKTFTMGTANNVYVEETALGIIPRVVRHIFAVKQARTEQIISQLSRQKEQGNTAMRPLAASLRHDNHAHMQLRVSYIEIYNESLRDLLYPDTDPRSIVIRENAKGGIVLSGAQEKEVHTYEEMMAALAEGSLTRTTASTLMNDFSSRSHSIFTITIRQRRSLLDNSSKGRRKRVEWKTSKLHLVDLAGSERNKKTGAVGMRFHESITINQGLLALGNVISALSTAGRKGRSKERSRSQSRGASVRHGSARGSRGSSSTPSTASAGVHVPYRQSKLTRLLQDSLGGNSRTLMIACVSVADVSLEETLTTLKYASRARFIRNAPKVNVVEEAEEEEPDDAKKDDEAAADNDGSEDKTARRQRKAKGRAKRKRRGKNRSALSKEAEAKWREKVESLEAAVRQLTEERDAAKSSAQPPQQPAASSGAFQRLKREAQRVSGHLEQLVELERSREKTKEQVGTLRTQLREQQRIAYELQRSGSSDPEKLAACQNLAGRLIHQIQDAQKVYVSLRDRIAQTRTTIQECAAAFLASLQQREAEEKNVFAEQSARISQLEKELEQARDDLSLDTQIFEEKNAELNRLTEVHQQQAAQISALQEQVQRLSAQATTMSVASQVSPSSRGAPTLGSPNGTAQPDKADDDLVRLEDDKKRDMLSSAGLADHLLASSSGAERMQRALKGRHWSAGAPGARRRLFAALANSKDPKGALSMSLVTTKETELLNVAELAREIEHLEQEKAILAAERLKVEREKENIENTAQEQIETFEHNQRKYETRLRDLRINIHMKEELLKEMEREHEDSHKLNEQYERTIRDLQAQLSSPMRAQADAAGTPQADTDTAGAKDPPPQTDSNGSVRRKSKEQRARAGRRASRSPQKKRQSNRKSSRANRPARLQQVDRELNRLRAQEIALKERMEEETQQHHEVLAQRQRELETLRHEVAVQAERIQELEAQNQHYHRQYRRHADSAGGGSSTHRSHASSASHSSGHHSTDLARSSSSPRGSGSADEKKNNFATPARAMRSESRVFAGFRPRTAPVKRRVRGAGGPLFAAGDDDEDNEDAVELDGLDNDDVLRTGPRPASALDDKTAWLEEQINAFLQEKKAFERLKEDVKRRQRLIEEKENMLLQRERLRAKHMRGSARLRRSVQNLDAQLSSIDHQLQQKQTQQLRHSLTLALSGDPPSEVVTLVSPRKATQQLRPATAAAASSQSPSDFALNIQQMKLQTEMEELKRNRHELHQRRSELQRQFDDEAADADDEQLVQDLEDRIESLDAQIQYKTDEIEEIKGTLSSTPPAADEVLSARSQGHADSLPSAVDPEEVLVQRLSSVLKPRHEEDQERLTRNYVEMAMRLKQSQRAHKEENNRLRLQLAEKERLLAELTPALQLSQSQSHRGRLQLPPRPHTQASSPHRGSLMNPLPLRPSPPREQGGGIDLDRELEEATRHGKVAPTTVLPTQGLRLDLDTAEPADDFAWEEDYANEDEDDVDDDTNRTGRPHSAERFALPRIGNTAV